jgi:N utilization substance protein B
MQLLYALNRDASLNREEILQRYSESIDQSFELFLFNLYNLIHTTEIAVEDKKKRSAKHLPSEEDQIFTAKLFENPIIQSLLLNSRLQDKFDKLNFGAKVTDLDFFKKLYIGFSKDPIYKTYLANPSETENHREALLELFKHMRKNEYFNEVMDDHYTNWTDDKSLAVGTIKKSIKILPSERDDFFEDFYPDSETAMDFGRTLLVQVFDHDQDLEDLIQPTLKNWDMERLAILDTILLKMALGEFLFFSTIPTKVTLNEYVEISKLYSTPKSKDFINGILDKLMKSLISEGKIKKEGRGLQE